MAAPGTAAQPAGLDAYLTVDVEPDCPPYLWTWRGILEGMPDLLGVFNDEQVTGTFFTTGRTAESHPDCVASIVRAGHEIGCHGYSHTSFRTMDEDTARHEIETTNAILRAYGPVTSFRAPYLAFPEAFAPLLTAAGIVTDASRAAYKRNEAPFNGDLKRLTASVTSSVLRLPEIIRDPWLARLRSPVVLFVHPWEFVDLTATGIRLDCRFRTGAPALASLRSAVRLLKARGAVFKRVQDFHPGPDLPIG